MVLTVSEGLIHCSGTKPESYGRGSGTSSGTGANDGRVCGITGRPSSLFRIRSDLLVGCFGGLGKQLAFEKDVSAPSRCGGPTIFIQETHLPAPLLIPRNFRTLSGLQS